MDLRSMLNEGTAPAAAPPTPSKAPPPPQQQQGPPLTPVQTVPPQSFRDYSQSTQASPGRVASHDYPSQQTPFRSPPPYPPAGTPYASRPAPPPLQPLSNNDVRSPSVSSISGPSPSYRHTPTSSVSGVAGYPFPPTQAGPASPAQQHRYPPSTAFAPRDSFSQPPGPGSAAGPPGGAPYMPGQAMPQTPPIGTPGSAHPYLHQRSQSTHSNSTPTSAQSQQQYGPPYGSPVASTHPLPPSEYARQPSQPPTPLGPPLSAGPRPSPGAGSFAQPPSPYQQRMSATSSYPYQSQQQQMSPAPPPPPSLQRTSTNQSLYDASSHPAEPHRRSISQSDRDRSVSVSPKTRVPSLPSSTGHQSISGAPSDSDTRHLSQGHMPVMDPMDRERAITPAKRKMEDRDLRSDEIERQERRPPPFESNGSYVSHMTSRASASPLLQRKKRLRHTAPPIWAQAYDGRQPLNKGNFIVRKPTPLSNSHVNGKNSTTTPVKNERASSRHVSPDASRSSAPAPQAPQSQPAPVQPLPSGPNPLLGAWEPAFTGKKPLDELARQVADFLFMNVIHNQDIGDIQGYVQRGELQWEVEAKLGTLVSKEHQARVYFPITTESILSDSSRIMFVSSMTETQHKSYNDWLNQLVVETDARNPMCIQYPRVPIRYRHRRETDRFFELPPTMRNRLPPPVQNLLNTKHRVKVRVSTDKQSQEVLAKIVKVRVADLDIHFPDTTLDCRISVNLEIDWHDSIQELEQLAANAQIDRQADRNKDRLSYSQSHYQIDLTQVTQKVPGPGNTERMQKEHELEIELDGPTLFDHGSRALHGEPSAYSDLVEGFVDNIRLLARKAKEFGGN